LEIRRTNNILAIASSLLVFSSTAGGQAVTQVLEEVVGFTDGTAVRVNREGESLLPISQLDVVGTDFRACELTAAGLVCLKGNDVYIWNRPTPVDPDEAVDPGELLFSCADDALPFDKNKSTACTSATTSAAGDEFILGGKGKGKLYDLTHVMGCDAPEADGWAHLSDNPEFCYNSLATGRPLIVGLELVKKDSSLPPGVLVLEERTRASVVQFDGTIDQLGDSKAFGLKGNERLTGLTALRLDEAEFGVDAENDFLLATTTKDSIISLSTGPGSPGNDRVFDIQVSRDARGLTSANECAYEGPQSPIKTGFKSGLVYVTDGQYCDLLVLEPAEDPDGPFKLVEVAVIDTEIDTVQFALEGATAAPGITINLANCVSLGRCAFIADTGGNDKDDVEVLDLRLADGSASSAIAYQIKNLPDCRYIPDVCVALEQYRTLYADFLEGGEDNVDNALRFMVKEGVIVLEPGNLCTDPLPNGCSPGDNPGGWRLNAAPLMPAEVTDAVTIPDPFLISRFWRGQKTNGFIWEALFVDARDVVTEGTFEIIFDTEDLVTSGLGAVLGCNLSPANLAEALAEDLVTTVSENFLSGSSPNDEYRDSLTNAPGCGSAKTLGDRFSLKPYNLEQIPCSVAYDVVLPAPADNDHIDWMSDGACAISGGVEDIDDAVFMKTLLSLWADYGDVLRNFACGVRDGVQPLTSSDCNNELIPTYVNGTDKLAKCWDALRQPKQSAGDQNCAAWLSQTSSLRSNIVVATQNASGLADPANRKGELLVRIDVILNLYHTRVVPTIEDGFIEPTAL
jgi:hypothetical protein